jgi:hypothetical protein
LGKDFFRKKEGAYVAALATNGRLISTTGIAGFTLGDVRGLFKPVRFRA